MTEKFYSMTELVKLTDNLIAALPTSFYSGIMSVRGGLVITPTADVREVVHGKWIAIIPHNSDYRGFKCNKCGAQFQGIHRDNFCGNCGASMEVEHE